MLIRSDMSGMSCLSGLRASVETFPLSWAFPTSEYSARPSRMRLACPMTNAMCNFPQKGLTGHNALM
jgi:hypothetical protein